MAKTQQSFNKKEIEKKKMQKRQDKAQRKEERKNTKGDSSWEDMIAYVDENGNISSTPPDASAKKTIDANSIVTGSRNTGETPSARTRSGKVMFFNEAKGYGFIKDNETGQSVYVAGNVLLTAIRSNDTVTFETEQSDKGVRAIKVKVIK